ncbi:hypothetical protein AAWM_04026 [Aspergillus awamori]|uniref:Uncharacterized protein n=1 Tax=Aspergillus awamori TaxID=105351 RepID=A0A401KPG0_ASPAW|nr:hypothetical protein AAWM_04026 [Aspergillus awamori]
MASLCVGYLSLPGFEIFLPDESVADLISTGYYAVLDYAVCFWSSRLQECLKHAIDQKDEKQYTQLVRNIWEMQMPSYEPQEGLQAKDQASHFSKPKYFNRLPSPSSELGVPVQLLPSFESESGHIKTRISGQFRIWIPAQIKTSISCPNSVSLLHEVPTATQHQLQQEEGQAE